MGGLSFSHLLILFVIVLIFFGPSKLPGLGQALGKAIRNFKSGISTDDPEDAPKLVNDEKPDSATAQKKKTESNQDRG